MSISRAVRFYVVSSAMKSDVFINQSDRGSNLEID